MSSQNEAFGDEDEIAFELWQRREAYKESQADDWRDSPDSW
jgi:hypothetical protein